MSTPDTPDETEIEEEIEVTDTTLEEITATGGIQIKKVGAGDGE